MKPPPKYPQLLISSLGKGQTVEKAMDFIHEAQELLLDRSSFRDNRQVRQFQPTPQGKEDKEVVLHLLDLMSGIRQEAKAAVEYIRPFPERRKEVGDYPGLYLDDDQTLEASAVVKALQKAQYNVLRRIFIKNTQPDGQKELVFNPENEHPERDAVTYAVLTQCLLYGHNKALYLCGEGWDNRANHCSFPIKDDQLARPLEDLCADYRKVSMDEVLSDDPRRMQPETIESLIKTSLTLLNWHATQAQAMKRVGVFPSLVPPTPRAGCVKRFRVSLT